jgi:ATP-binding cassette, subfamily B, bacterial
MAGHRTRLAQESPASRHDGETAALSQYLLDSQAIDSTGKWLVAFLPRGWLIAGLLWLIPSAISGASAGPALAIQLGGVMLAFTAMRKLSDSAVEIMSALTAATRVKPLFRAARHIEKPGHLLPPQRASQSAEPGKAILEADQVSYRYKPTGAPALHATSMVVRRGEKVLIEGSSGGGKTTFASLLCGMRTPASGLLLLHGLDPHTLGPQSWRKRVASAPQFHENYILTETLAFNLLLGRQWPPSQSDLEQAESLCRELGLGTLLDRMPGGIEQMVGEGGWQLSHGERSRIYIARALLQNADVVVLDESFGALDPETLVTSLRTTVDHSETLLVIAHP